MGEAKKNTLLIVDDATDVIQLLLEILGPDYKVLAATSGEKMLEMLTRPVLPDMILLDVTMPGIGGHEACRRMKADARTSHIPVLFVSGANTEQAKQECVAAGGVGLLSKPFSFSQLEQAIEAELKRAD